MHVFVVVVTKLTHLRSLHHITLNLQLPRHEQALRIRFSSNQFSEIIV